MRNHSSRGIAPDAKRGRRGVLRVLQEMGAPVLDSDMAATVDALLERVRLTTRGVSCRAGSPDLGFLVTPGRLLGVFAEMTQGLKLEGGGEAWLDYRHRDGGRYPALHVAAAPGSPTKITTRLPFAPDWTVSPRAVLWARVEAATTIVVNGKSVALQPQAPDKPQRVAFDAGANALSPLQITVPAGAAVWLFRLEQDEAAGARGRFWVAPGTFHLDGMVVEAAAAAPFPSAPFPEAAGFPWAKSPDPGPPLDGLIPPLAEGTEVVAYLEAWERHITHIEDPGIREEALGASGDTSTRTQLVGQVKLASVTVDDMAADAVRAAFGNVAASGGQLTISVPSTPPITDPCALPDPGGYRGADNRLYRVEVKAGGGLANAVFAWSRENGADLFAAQVDKDGRLVFPAGTPLAAGDLVEVLSHVVDLGDDVIAKVNANAFVPAERATGQLAQLKAVPTSGLADEVLFTLVSPADGNTNVAVDDRYGVGDERVLKVRRWDGLLEPGGSAGPHVLEDGISVTLSGGQYRPGQYWQYEARVGRNNANGPWRPDPHGPERLFAPLALLRAGAAGKPFELVAWLDERFSRLCELDADDVAFSGGRVGSASDTVQEAIEELFERPPEIVDSSCGELIVRSENGLQSVFDTIPDGESARLCIQPGTWNLNRPIEVEGKGDLLITCAGAATVLRGEGIDTVLRFRNCGRVRIQDLTIEGGAFAGTGDGLAGALSLIDCAGVDLQRLTVSCQGATSRRRSAVEIRNVFPAAMRPEVRVRDCELRAGHAQVGLLVVNAATADIEGNLIDVPVVKINIEEALGDPEVLGRVARLAVENVSVEEFSDEDLVGGNWVAFDDSLPDGRRRLRAAVGEWSAKYVFTTSLTLDEEQWLRIFEQTPIPGRGAVTPHARVERHLRMLRRNLARAMFGQVSGLGDLDPKTRDTLAKVGASLRLTNAQSAGEQGIVLGGNGSAIDAAFPQPVVLPAGRPDARIVNNRVLGFTQGIHVGTSGRSDGLERGLSYRVVIEDNTVHLRVPGLARDRHGIFVGSAFQTRVLGNTVELRTPEPAKWSTAPSTDAIRAHGTYGPLLQIVDNNCIGTARGVVAHAINHYVAVKPGWRWTVAGNAHVPAGSAPPEQWNW